MPLRAGAGEPFERLRERGAELRLDGLETRVPGGRGARLGDDDEVDGGKRRGTAPEHLFDEPTNAVSDHGVAHTAAHGVPEPRLGAVGTGASDERECIGVDAEPGVLDPGVLSPTSNALLAR